jgi:hypothetical protein
LRPYGSTDANTYLNDAVENGSGWIKEGSKASDIAKWKLVSANNNNGETLTLTLNTVGSYSYATTCMPFPMKVSASSFIVKTYIGVKRHDNLLTLKEITGTIPAATPIVIIASTTGSPKVNITIDTQTTSYPDVSGNLLTGAILPTQTDENDLTFGKYNDVAGFYLDSQRYLHANRAYIKSSTAAKEGLSLYWEGMTTAIKPAVNSKLQGTTLRYNLQGQPVDASYKGIVIMNGKKSIQR